MPSSRPFESLPRASTRECDVCAGDREQRSDVCAGDREQRTEASRRPGDSDIPRVYSIGLAETCVPVSVNNVPTYVPVTVNNAQRTSVGVPTSWQKQPDESPLGSITSEEEKGVPDLRTGP